MLGWLADRNDDQHCRAAALALSSTVTPVVANEPNPAGPWCNRLHLRRPAVIAASSRVAVAV